MGTLQQPRSLFFFADRWRYVVLGLLVAGSLASLLWAGPLRQYPDYHDFADRRPMLGIPNFLDVASNVPFLIVGLAGIVLCFGNRDMKLRVGWITLFAAVTMVSAGSIWYHLNPNDETLVWDRLPMTIGFMGLFVALLGEYAGERLGRSLLIPAVLLGGASVFYWRWSGDLRLYVWIQLIPFLMIPVVMILFRRRYTHQWVLLVALGFYVLAKIAEFRDHEVFALSGNLFSGHTLKHLLAAAACALVLVMLKVRKPVAGESS